LGEEKETDKGILRGPIVLENLGASVQHIPWKLFFPKAIVLVICEDQ
jgi:hypothetical protein